MQSQFWPIFPFDLIFGFFVIYSFLWFDTWNAICATVGAGALLCHRRIFKRIFKSLGHVRAEGCRCILLSVVATRAAKSHKAQRLMAVFWIIYDFKIFCLRDQRGCWTCIRDTSSLKVRPFAWDFWGVKRVLLSLMEGSLQGGIDDVGSAEERKLSLDRNLTFALVPWSDGSVGPVGTCWRSNWSYRRQAQSQ